jgi:AcrR family transcriptional regulator
MIYSFYHIVETKMKNSSTTQKQRIKKDLIRQGRNLFAQYGLKGTSVRELTMAVGIAQGSFYSFYDAKEELFFDILEQEETAIAQAIVTRLNARKLNRAHLKSVIEWSLENLRNNPVLRTVLDPAQYKRLLRKIPNERLQTHLQNEKDMVSKAVADLQANGSIAPIDPELLMGLLHALFVTTLHQDEIGAELFPRTLDLLTGLVADHVATQGKRTV